MVPIGRHAILTVLVLLGMAPGGALAVRPPSAGMLEGYRADGSLAARRASVEARGNHRVREDLAARKAAEVEAWRSGTPRKAEAFPYATGLPAQGAPRIFTLLIDFPDHPHTQDRAIFESKIYGDGVPAEFPLESLRNFYRRSSYGALDIQGVVLGWYRATQNRSSYGADDYTGVAALIREALNQFNATHDFAPYDNNNDGRIDYFCVIWSGPDEGWGGLWWPWCDADGELFANDFFSVDGKRLGVFSWQWEKNLGQQEPAFIATTIIHESGHALGLPDYYDYDDAVGPRGGCGGFDIMDGLLGDHNTFSKWLLDWTAPAVYGAADGVHRPTLRAAAVSGDGVALMPGLSPANPFTEFFLIENRHAAANDLSLLRFPAYAGGLAIWHVDATLNTHGNNFANDNSYTPHKLLRLMEADGLEQIEQNQRFDPGDLYGPGRSLTPGTAPSSRSYAGADTGIRIENIAAPGETLSADITLGGSAVVRGDVNGDGIINAADAILTARQVAGLATLTGDAAMAADADENGSIQQADVDWILEKTVGVR